jgi:hypothetical protein
MTVNPTAGLYELPTDVNTTSPLVDPSHSDLHNQTNNAVLDLNVRTSNLELLLSGLTAPDGSIEQARLVAHQWAVKGPLTGITLDAVLIPLIWNITGRVVTFSAAKASVLTPADADIVIDMVIGAEISGPMHDTTGGTQTSILQTPLVIPAGAYYSATLDKSGFVGDHPIGSYIAAFVEGIGTAGAPGADLSIQLNRNL